MANKISMASITINGDNFSGNNITMNGNKIFIDGKEHKTTDKIVNILVHGDVKSITAPGANEVIVSGSCDIIKTTSGDIEVGGDVGTITATSGDVKVDGEVGGNVTTMSGDVRCGN